MGIYSITDEKVKRPIPDYSANHCSPSDRMRTESTILFSGISQMSVSRVKVDKQCVDIRQNTTIIAWFPLSINRENLNAAPFQEFWEIYIRELMRNYIN